MPASVVKLARVEVALQITCLRKSRFGDFDPCSKGIAARGSSRRCRKPALGRVLQGRKFYSAFEVEVLRRQEEPAGGLCRGAAGVATAELARLIAIWTPRFFFGLWRISAFSDTDSPRGPGKTNRIEDQVREALPQSA